MIALYLKPLVWKEEGLLHMGTQHPMSQESWHNVPFTDGSWPAPRPDVVEGSVVSSVIATPKFMFALDQWATLVLLLKTTHIFIGPQHSQRVKTPQKSQPSFSYTVSYGTIRSTWDAFQKH